MNELHRHMLRVSSVGPASKRQKPSAAQESLRHFAASFGQAMGFLREKRFERPIANE
jgi:hypothetical protein